MEKPCRLWGVLEACLLTMCAWSWGVCRVSLLALILTFHLYGGFILLGLILASVAGILYKFQDVLLYFPDQPSSSRLYVPMPTGIPLETVYIRTKDGVRLNLILLRYTGENPATAPTILYFHGNAGNIGHRVPNALLMLVNLKVNVVLLDYRGYGKSEGEPSEEGLYQDAEATLDYIMTRPDIDKTKVVLFGRSLGGGVAIRLASCNPHRVGRYHGGEHFPEHPAHGGHTVLFLPHALPTASGATRTSFCRIDMLHCAVCHLSSFRAYQTNSSLRWWWNSCTSCRRLGLNASPSFLRARTMTPGSARVILPP